MGKYWKEPKEKIYYSFFVEGKRIDTVADCASTQKEKARLEALHGIEVRKATPEELISINAFTILPKRIIGKMNSAMYAIRNKRAR